VNAPSDAVSDMTAGESPFDLEATFRAQYEFVTRIIRRVVRDPARAEELAVEVFLKLWRSPEAQGEKAEAWLYRSATRKGLDELRRRTRRTPYESMLGFARPVPTPEEVCTATEEQEKVRLVLAVIQRRQAASRINYRIAIGDGALAKKYGGVTSLPETFLIDREGRIADRHVGIVGQSDYESEIVQLLEK
jgi:RNA polymerase sigma-70 factor (ECF subfamily)